jgi:hypothetical protein
MRTIDLQSNRRILHYRLILCWQSAVRNMDSSKYKSLLHTLILLQRSRRRVDLDQACGAASSLSFS